MIKWVTFRLAQILFLWIIYIMSNQITARNLHDIFAKLDAMKDEDKPDIYNGEGKPTVKLTTARLKNDLRSASGHWNRKLPDENPWDELMLMAIKKINNKSAKTTTARTRFRVLFTGSSPFVKFDDDFTITSRDETIGVATALATLTPGLVLDEAAAAAPAAAPATAAAPYKL